MEDLTAKRKAELMGLLPKSNNDCRVRSEQLIDEIVFVESQLIELKNLPMIAVNPNNPQQQRATPASKLYKEFLQQYNNCIKTLNVLLGFSEENGESPLREWVKNYGGK